MQCSFGCMDALKCFIFVLFQMIVLSWEKKTDTIASYIYIYILIHRISYVWHIFTCIYCVCIHIYVFVYVYMRIYIHVWIYIWIYVCIYVCVYISPTSPNGHLFFVDNFLTLTEEFNIFGWDFDMIFLLSWKLFSQSFIFFYCSSP